jgi:hypothetical protein
LHDRPEPVTGTLVAANPGSVVVQMNRDMLAVRPEVVQGFRIVDDQPKAPPPGATDTAAARREPPPTAGTHAARREPSPMADTHAAPGEPSPGARPPAALREPLPIAGGEDEWDGDSACPPPAVTAPEPAPAAARPRYVHRFPRLFAPEQHPCPEFHRP